MTPRLYRVSIPCRMLVLAFDEEAAAHYGVEDFDAQADNMIQEEMTVMKVTETNIASKERGKFPYFADDVKDRVIRAASNWLTVIAAEEEEERRKREDFEKRQLKLPGIE